MSCFFCSIPEEKIIKKYEHWIIIRDGFPITKDHTLIIPKKHIAKCEQLNVFQWTELFYVINDVVSQLKKDIGMIDFNVGINDGPLAGQTIKHLHVHIIPRFEGDCEDPRGGVRWIMPEKANYWDKKD